ncbi:maleylpyruvate isomerase family mycothiol-dependent enzyme [Antrihabitans sp. YC2-6]|uniref:maleylpyruvate isomerase family mycothiol-dependent enzyme n=1 Tax=Antrihabitans sp. YC2-6 TaxID=2799498 RepID=UPI0018F4CBB6|nr:maleylpyruvate isomerase family mycothiol-dependent enzyme [Antrihabitans sp. YC2-6]MBJ8343721.1 maleylpyruvate isomerase family mycothiol-dependent enzyme [Antrihabitans sp. YC2-6]
MTQIMEIRPISRESDAKEVALASYDDLLDLIDSLADEDWRIPTECPGWTVEDMVGHLIGAAKANASKREMLRQQLWGYRHSRDFDGNPLDAANALQVRDHADLTATERKAALRTLASDAVRGRMSIPKPLRAASVSVAGTGSTSSMPKKAKLGHAMDVVLTRDVWMHRIDISRATGRDIAYSAVDARIVEDVVSEWARAHNESFSAVLSGPAGGTFEHGSGGPRIEMNAIEFCRTLSGRAHGTGLLATKIWF